MQTTGYDKKLWNGNGKPASEDKDWEELTKEERDAAEVLGMFVILYRRHFHCLFWMVPVSMFAKLRFWITQSTLFLNSNCRLFRGDMGRWWFLLLLNNEFGFCYTTSCVQKQQVRECDLEFVMVIC